MKLLAFLILTIPTDWELFAERKGEAPEHKKRSATVRVVLMFLCSLVTVLIWAWPLLTPTGAPPFKDFAIQFVKSLALSFAIFVMFFDYSYNIMFHGKTKVWYEYLSKSPIDKAWSGWNWKWRMVVRIVIFISANIFYLWN